MRCEMEKLQAASCLPDAIQRRRLRTIAFERSCHAHRNLSSFLSKLQMSRCQPNGVSMNNDDGCLAGRERLPMESSRLPKAERCVCAVFPSHNDMSRRSFRCAGTYLNMTPDP